MPENRTTLSFDTAVRQIHDKLVELRDQPHGDFEGHGGLCPICGLTTSLLNTLETKAREELDARREHLEAQRRNRRHVTTGNRVEFTYRPTPPSGPPPLGMERSDV